MTEILRTVVTKTVNLLRSASLNITAEEVKSTLYKAVSKITGMVHSILNLDMTFVDMPNTKMSDSKYRDQLKSWYVVW